MSVIASGQRVVRNGHDILVLTRVFDAPIEEVWAAVTTPARLARWFGTWTGDPESGAVQVRMTAEGDVPEETYTILECNRPSLLHVRAGEGHAAWDIAVQLAEQEETTILEFSQAIDDPASWESIGPGWEYYLDRLIAAVSDGDPAAVNFDRDYYPALSHYYTTLTATAD